MRNGEVKANVENLKRMGILWSDRKNYDRDILTRFVKNVLKMTTGTRKKSLEWK